MYRRHKLNYRRLFMERWPDLRQWVSAPLADRVGRLYGETVDDMTCRIAWQARPYIVFLALRGYVGIDYPWLLSVNQLYVAYLADQLGIDLGLNQLADEARVLGYTDYTAYRAMQWAVTRIALHTGDPNPAHISQSHIDEFLQAMCEYSDRLDVTNFYASFKRYQWLTTHMWGTHLHLLQAVLYHRHQVDAPPRRVMPRYAEPPPPLPAMQAVVNRYLATRRLTSRPATVAKLKVALRYFLLWIARADPTVSSFADVTRQHILDHLTMLAEEPSKRSGQPLAPRTRRTRISSLSVFFRDTTGWGWEDVPTRPLITAADLPRSPLQVPRFIPDDELNRLMTAVAELPCPYQRAALVVARWSGARKGEIIRLSVDCLDEYPDGTPRLRLPAGKTFRERLVPVHEEAADALRLVMADRRGREERAIVDEVSGIPTQYLFVIRGKLVGYSYLFRAPLRKACKIAGLVDETGRATVTAHRFRHTVGTQLAERGARLHTIMSVLGHRSVGMAMVYSQISNAEMLKDYKAVLGPGAIIAGPAAEGLRRGQLASTAIDWLKCNFFKTELELGHCLRLPSEGPCECDLYLNCAKFVTTPTYAPRLRERLKVESTLMKDAENRGWSREIERHQATVTRINQLLTDLGELEDCPEKETKKAATLK